MNTIKINTKQPQVVSTSKVPAQKEIVYLEIINKVHHFADDRYEFGIRYYYEVTEDGNTKQIDVPDKRKGRTLTAQEVNYVAAQITPTGNNYTEIERSYTLAGAFAIVSADSAENWGLTASDWEVTTANND
jgi:hypothetical protein